MTHNTLGTHYNIRCGRKYLKMDMLLLDVVQKTLKHISFISLSHCLTSVESTPARIVIPCMEVPGME